MCNFERVWNIMMATRLLALESCILLAAEILLPVSLEALHGSAKQTLGSRVTRAHSHSYTNCYHAHGCQNTECYYNTNTRWECRHLNSEMADILLGYCMLECSQLYEKGLLVLKETLLTRFETVSQRNNGFY